MPSNVTPAIPASQLVNVVPSVLPAGGSPLQFWGLIVDANLDRNGYPVLPSGVVVLFDDLADVEGYFGGTSQEAGLGAVYFTGPTNATVTPSGLLAAQYSLYATPGYLLGGSVAGISLGQLQALDESISVVVDGNAPVTATVNLATATSFSNAAELIGVALGTTLGSRFSGIQKGEFTASLSGTTMTVSALIQGPQQAVAVANLQVSGNLMVVESVTEGYLAIGQVVTGTGLTAGTTILSYEGDGAPGGAGTYTLSQAPTAETGVTVSAFAPAPVIALGDVVAGTGLTANTYVAAFGTGTGGTGTYTLSTAATSESNETVTSYAPPVVYSVQHSAFKIHSGTQGSASSVAFATGALATSLNLTQSTGATSSAGAAASSPATFMNAILQQTQNWVSFMTTWEPTDADKSTSESSSFAWWTNAQKNGYRYCMWETNVLDTTESPASASSAEINSADLSGTVMIWTNPAITTLAGEKAAFSMSWAASLNFDAQNGRQTAAFKSYAGGLADVTNGQVADYLGGDPQAGTFGNGVNFYGDYTTRSQGFNEWQRGFVSGPFTWDDTYTDQIWLNNALQEAVMVGLAAANSVPYANPGYAQVHSWCLDPILAAVNFGAIVAGVTLSDAQIQAVNQATGLDAASVLQQRGWYLQIKPATAQVRGLRTSPPITFYWVDGGSIQSINIASITVQ